MNDAPERILVTGAAGFIGAFVCRSLLEAGHEVAGVDNFSDYYDPELKRARVREVVGTGRLRLFERDLADPAAVEEVHREFRPQRHVHLAAQPGVRYSLVNPGAYIAANLVAFANVLESCRRHGTRHLVFASSSSVYGGNSKVPFSERDPVDHPVSLYAATKKANEAMAHSYSHLFGIPTTGLRFFTVYGPWGRPDMAPIHFTKSIIEGRPIQVFNNGDMKRDFTYVEDIVEGVTRVLWSPAMPMAGSAGGADAAGSASAPWRIYNIGNSNPVPLLEFIETLERLIGRRAVMEFKPMQPGDVPVTYADTSLLEAAVGFRPNTTIEVGLEQLVRWYRRYFAC